ncbi:MAG: carbon-nitrogen hydrolase family protein [Deltaproteobacteria bacterium]|jgi:predicted amidohydrolase|nr:carbon-nitrogen hydrolase family protein [Deltaproteobacteria bacterium]
MSSKAKKNSANGSIKIALLHMEIEKGHPEKNMKTLLALARRAGSLGAKIVCAPELCLSGYSFDNYKEAYKNAQAEGNWAFKSLSSLAKEIDAFVTAGILERHGTYAIVYNSAFAFGPNGKLVCRYRKINSEPHWAAPGAPSQQNVFQTPWGGVGLLICSDSYHALLARTTTVKGACLIVLPSNWPNSKDDFPNILWRQRARENGVWLAAVNRCGREPEIDFSNSKSSLIDFHGNLATALKESDQNLSLFEIPLNSQGFIPNQREKKLESRVLKHFHPLYANFNSVKDVTSLLDLPKPGPVEVKAVVSGQDDPLAFLWPKVKKFKSNTIVLLPRFHYNKKELSKFLAKALLLNIHVFGCDGDSDSHYNYFLQISNQGKPKNIKPNFKPWFIGDCGPVRVIFGPLEILDHPEAAVVAAKSGVDLALCPASELSDDDLDLVALRPIEQLAVCSCGLNAGAFYGIPRSEGLGPGAKVKAGEILSFSFNSIQTREKRFQERIDYEALFSKPVDKSAWSYDNF